MTDGWNNGSGEVYSAPFAEAHTYIVWEGQYYAASNRINNTAAYNGLFEGIYKSTQLHATVDKLSFLRPDIALVYVLAAKVSEKDKLAGLKLGADDYLTKPFSSKELLVRVDNLIEQRTRLHQSFATLLVFGPEVVV